MTCFNRSLTRRLLGNMRYADSIAADQPVRPLSMNLELHSRIISKIDTLSDQISLHVAFKDYHTHLSNVAKHVNTSEFEGSVKQRVFLSLLVDI